MQSFQNLNFDQYIQSNEFKDAGNWTNQSSMVYFTRINTGKIIEHQKAILQGEQQIINQLKDVVQSIGDLKNNSVEQGSQLSNDPQCLRVYKEKASSISKIEIGFIIAGLQYHLGVLNTPRINTQLTVFKEKNNTGKHHEQSYTLDTLKQFIAPQNEKSSLISLCNNEAVKMHLCQLAVHDMVDKKDRDRCIYLLCRTEDLNRNEENNLYLIKHLSGKIEKILLDQQTYYENKINNELLKQTKMFNKQFNILKKQVDQVIQIQQATNINNQMHNLSKASTNKFSFFVSPHQSNNKPISSKTYIERKRSYSI